jgi:hypothetical protein
MTEPALPRLDVLARLRRLKRRGRRKLRAAILHAILSMSLVSDGTAPDA